MARSGGAGDGAIRMWTAALVLLTAAGMGVPLAGQEADTPESEVPFVPTPMEVVDDILELARTTASDTVYDLGSGDGRVPIRAARRYGAHGVGVELDSSLVAMSRRRAREAGVAERVRFVRGDLFDTDLRPASVLVLYLNTPFNMRLRPRILEQMRPGSRVISHVFDMGQWPADTVVHRLEFGAFLYRWTVPADVEGRWRVTLESGARTVVELDQKFGRVCVVGGTGWQGASPATRRGTVEGRSVLFPVAGLEGRTVPLPVRGTATGGRMTGWTSEGEAWMGVRVSDPDGSLERWEASGSTDREAICGGSEG